MRIRKRLVACFAALLAGIGFATPTTAAAASIPVTCGSQSGGGDLNQSTQSPVTAVRVGRHSEEGGFDRFVIEFAGAQIPHWEAIPKSGATFYKDASGAPVTLEGTAGIKLVVRPIVMGSYKAANHFDTEFPQLAEAFELGDNEAVFTWGLGLEKQSCKRIFMLSGPTRLVVDVPY
jgi:hypothetical protein